MYYKIAVFMCAAIMISATTFAQTIKQNIDKQYKNPQRQEQAAKADVHLHKNKNIIDTTHSATLPNKKKKTKRSSSK